jgi:hypothetical protein
MAWSVAQGQQIQSLYVSGGQAKKSWSCIQQQVCSSIYSLPPSQITQLILNLFSDIRSEAPCSFTLPTNLHLTKDSNCQGAAEQLEQGASWLWFQLSWSTTSVDGSLRPYTAAVIGRFLLHCRPMDSPDLPPTHPEPGQGCFLLAMKNKVFAVNVSL